MGCASKAHGFGNGFTELLHAIGCGSVGVRELKKTMRKETVLPSLGRTGSRYQASWTCDNCMLACLHACIAL